MHDHDSYYIAFKVMPIVVEAVSLEKYLSWLDSQV